MNTTDKARETPAQAAARVVRDSGLGLTGRSRQDLEDRIHLVVAAFRDEAYREGVLDAAKLIDAAGEEWSDKARDRKSKTWSAYAIAALDLRGQVRALLPWASR